METPQNTPYYRVSVLLDLMDNPELVLYNAVQLTKRLGGTLEVFHVKSAGQSTADALSEIESLIAQLQRHEEGMPIGHRLEYGNVRHRIRDYLALVKPDVLVMGKRRNRMGILGESITEFVIDQTNATNIFVFGEGQRLGSFDELHLGVFGRNLNEKGKHIIMDLKKDSQSAVRLFDINSQTGETEQPTYPWQRTIPYVFTQSATALDALISYVNRTQTELLCMPKGPSRTFAFQTNAVREVLHKAKIPLMILA